MNNLVILGAGTAGTMMANHMNHHLKNPEWQIIIIAVSYTHLDVYKRQRLAMAAVDCLRIACYSRVYLMCLIMNF